LALKATIYKAQLQIADVDRALYADHALTLALHPSETEERLAVRLLAFALRVPHDDAGGALQFARGLSDADEPDLWQHDLTGRLLQWVEVGQPDARRIGRACGRAGRVSILAYGPAVPIWWSALADKVARYSNLTVEQLASAQARALAGLVRRSMAWQVTVQDGTVWVGDGEQSVELAPQALQAAAR
jgi:uncharacterized protein YaeQ